MNQDWKTVKWFAKFNDLIGGWCVGTDDRPPSREGVVLVADFITEDVARYVASLHNDRLSGNEREA